MLTMCRSKEVTKVEDKKQDLVTVTQTSSRKSTWRSNAVAEQPEAENNRENDKTRVTNCLITTQHLATAVPHPQRNYLHAVGNLCSPDKKSRVD